jgi:inosine-uridine nucleoside N-ribohydrolase
MIIFRILNFQTTLILLSLLFFSSAKAQPKIIFDTDFGGDADDLGALSMLHGFHQSGEAELLAVMIWNREEFSVAGVDATNRYYGHTEIPIGVREGEPHSLEWNFSRAIARELPHEHTNRDARGAVDLYREILSGVDDNSVIIVTVGPLANIQNLLQSGPDYHSELTGKELFHQKVEKMVVMGGEYPTGRQEWNFWGNMEGVTLYVFDHVDVPVVFLGYEIGVRIQTGNVFNKLPKDHPLYLGFYHFSKYAPWMSERFTGQILNNSTYDQTAVLYAVRDGVGEYWEKVEGGHNEIDSVGHNRWVDGEVTNQSFMRLIVEPDVLARKIEKLMLFEYDIAETGIQRRFGNH